MIRSTAAVFAAFIILNTVARLGMIALGGMSGLPATVGGIAIRALGALLAGMAAAHVAAHHRTLHAVLFAVLMLVLGAVLLMAPPASAPAPGWDTWVIAVTGPLCAVLGGWLRGRGEGREAAKG